MYYALQYAACVVIALSFLFVLRHLARPRIAVWEAIAVGCLLAAHGSLALYDYDFQNSLTFVAIQYTSDASGLCALFTFLRRNTRITAWGFRMIVFGVFLNGFVVALNGGTMPSSKAFPPDAWLSYAECGPQKTQRVISPIHRPANKGTHARALGDWIYFPPILCNQGALVSPGDILVFGGFFIFALELSAMRFQKK